MRKTKLLSTLLLSVTLGAGVGQSFVDEGAYDDEDTAFSVFGGYQFNRYFGVEAGYADFGKIEPDVAGPALEGDSAYLTAVGTLPVSENFAVYAKAGVHRWNVDTSLPGLTGNNDDSGTDPTYGVGAQYRFTDRVALRGEYSRFEVEDADADLAQLQVRFDF
jgi:OmpA-OmpF porin, OOP family